MKPLAHATAAAALLFAACGSGESSDRAADKLSSIDWNVQSSGTTTLGQVAIAYDGDHVKNLAFTVNGASAGRMDVTYTDGNVHAIDVTDATGDRGSYGWNYADGRLASMVWSVPQVVTADAEYEYDDTAGGRARRVTTSTTWAGAQASSQVETFDYDESGRLEKREAVAGSNTSMSEIRYDADSRIERVTDYVGSSFSESTMSYDDQGRLSLVESNAGDRYELTYDDEGRIAEILVLAPSVGATWTVDYQYAPGSVEGLTFSPDVPSGDLVDLRGRAFDQLAFTTMLAPLTVDDVPSVQVQNQGSCDHDVCVAGDPLASTCDSCTEALCAADSYCCTGTWDSTCVGEVATYCGFGC